MRKTTEKKAKAGTGVAKPHPLAGGAKPCPVCKVQPMGILKTPEILDGDGNLKSGAVYETGCTVCRRRSRGATTDLATKKWNSGEYVKGADGKPA